MLQKKKVISAVDLFCGIGGLAYGLHSAGIKINAGIDIDQTCRFAFEHNCEAEFISESVDKVDPKKVSNLYGQDDFKILVGCAPFQLIH
jgi:DNA (cytosine-5)-methyltransferase 1